MKKIPQVLIIGRPNVGKSTLVNRIIKKNTAITLDVPGVTRDLATFKSEWKGRVFEIVDTGGVVFEDSDQVYLQDRINRLVTKAAITAERIVFLVDYLHGVHPIDQQIAQFLRPYKEKVLLVVNKIDNFDLHFDIGEYYALGFGDPFAISAAQGSGLSVLMDTITETFPKKEISSHQEPDYRIAIVGRPNVGKSSLVNAIMNEERVLVDSVAGTTRDSIEIPFTYEGKIYSFIDTAGLRRKSRVEDGIEYYSVLRTRKAILEADLTVLLLDASYYLCDQDKKIISELLDQKKPFLVFVNKWDLMERTDDVRQDLLRIAIQLYPTLEYFPFVFGSAESKLNIGKLFELIPAIIASSEMRISTPKLNQFIETATRSNPPPSKSGKHLKIFYATQMETAPPAFLFFINHPELMKEGYLRFLERKLRQSLYHFEGVPIQLFFRARRPSKV